MSTFQYCQVVNLALLRLLSTCILVLFRMLANYSIKLNNILYHWLLSMPSFRFCETYLLHIKLFVGNQSAISPFLGWYMGCESARQLVECSPQMVRRVSPGGGVSLVGLQEELRYPSGYTPRGLFRAQDGRRSKDFRVL